MHRERLVPRRRRLQLTALLVIAALGAGVVPATAAGGGTKTGQPAMLTPVAAGITVTPLITVGETAGDGGYVFESVPDGIAVKVRNNAIADVYVNHETSRVPFPYTPSAPTELNSQNDFDNAQVSLLKLHRKSAGVLSGSMVITSDSNYQRFCSSYLATAAEGFDREILFTNEESVDWVNRTGNAWPAVIGADAARQSGVVVAFDIKSGEDRPIWGMGRHNHENSVPIPGFDEIVMLSGDDTFTNNPSQSQLYSYIAPDADAVWNDQGALWAFQTNGPKQKYEHFVPGDATSVSGQFIPVPRLIATGRHPDGTEVMAADFGYPLPPNDGTWQRDPSGVGIDGPQWVLEYWSQQNHVFNFIRVEDIAYDKRPGMSNVAYVVDSGRGTAPIQPAPPEPPVPTFGPGLSTNGRVWKMVFDPNDPTKVTALSILIEGDDAAVKTVNEIHQPDNIESTVNGLYITEDPGSSQQFNFTTQLTDPRRTEARIWQYPFSTGVATVALKVDQSADEGPTDVDATTTRGNLGAWESSGIVDASAAFGPGAFLVDVQAGTLWVEKAPGADNVPPPGSDFTDKRAGGQLLLVRIPNG